MNDILLASSALNMMVDIKCFLLKKNDTKDIGEASYVIDIDIQRDRSRRILGLSHKTYIKKILKLYNI
jgi:hypothetical protein